MGHIIGKNVCYANCTRIYGETSESLEGHHGRDRMRRFRLLTSFQEGLEG